MLNIVSNFGTGLNKNDCFADVVLAHRFIVSSLSEAEFGRKGAKAGAEIFHLSNLCALAPLRLCVQFFTSKPGIGYKHWESNRRAVRSTVPLKAAFHSSPDLKWIYCIRTQGRLFDKRYLK